MKRREFLQYGAALLLQPRIRSQSMWAKDLALINASIVTLDPARPQAEAALVRRGRIALVGSNEEVRAEAGSARLDVYDASGRTVVPGFVDAHCHMEVTSSSLEYCVSVHAPPIRSIEEMQNILAAKARELPKGEWVIGRAGFALEDALAEKRLPRREELDAVSLDHPVIVFSGRHVGMMNTLALKTMGLWSAATATPPRGTIIHRDANGVPTGIGTEVYYYLPELPLEKMKSAIRTHVRPLFVSQGITTIYTVPYSTTDIRADLMLQQEGELPLRIRMYYHVPHMTTFDGLLNMGLVSGVGDDLFRFGGMKLFVDGLGGDGLGNPVDDVKWTQDELNHMVSTADAAGIQVILHVVTDAGLQMARAAIEAARRDNPRKPYLLHRIEHGGDDGTAEIMNWLRDLGVRISITPSRVRPGSTPPRYKTLVDEGLDPVLITDATGTNPSSSDVLFKIAAVVSNPPPEEALPFVEALRLFTLANAKIGYEDRDKGSIEVGKLGDFAVMTEDPRKLPPNEISGVKVAATILGGDVVYERGA